MPSTMGPKMISHIFIVWELISQLHRTSVAQGMLAGLFCVICLLHKVLSVNSPITHINCLGITVDAEK